MRVPAKSAEVSIVDDQFESIETIDVTASRVRLATAGASETFLDREDVQRMPHLADDAVRMLKVLPGVTGGDFSAALNIRGGRREEALLTVDGAEIHNGFSFSRHRWRVERARHQSRAGHRLHHRRHDRRIRRLHERRGRPADPAPVARRRIPQRRRHQFRERLRPHLWHLRGGSRLVAVVRAARVSRRAHGARGATTTSNSRRVTPTCSPPPTSRSANAARSPRAC